MRHLVILLAFLAFSTPIFAAIGWSMVATSAVNGPVAIASNKAIFSTYDGKTYALDADTGTVLWVSEAGGQVVFSAQLLDSDNVAVMTTDGKLVIAGMERGTAVCELNLDRLPTGFAAGQGKAYVALNGSVLAFDSSCQQIWAVPLGSSTGQIGLDATNVYLTSDRRLYAISSDSGEVKWSANTGDSFLSKPVEYGGVVYLGSTDKKLYAIDRKGGYLRWSYKTGGWVMSTPRPAGNAVYFSSNDGYFYALGKSGELLFKVSLPAGSWVQPGTYFFEGGTAVVFGANDGNVHAISGANGNELWTFSAYGKPGETTQYGQSFIFGTSEGVVYSLSSSPICSFTWPLQMETVGGWPVEIEGKASAKAGISKVEMRVAGGRWIAATGKSSWSAVADMTNIADGMVKVECRATDNAGKSESGEYASTILMKSENAPLQKMSVLSPSEVDVGGNYTILAMDPRGQEIRNLKVTIGGETRVIGGPVLFSLSKEGLNNVLIEKPGFEQVELEINAKGNGSPLPLIAVAALAMVGAYFLFKKMRKK